jgi:hypothetical protein
MKKLIVIGILGLSTIAKGVEDHHHEKEHPGHNHEKNEKEHSDKEHSHHEHGEKEEGKKNVGKNKGVTSFDEDMGFTLSKEAIKNFSVKTEVMDGNGPWVVPVEALLLTGKEKNIYRYRKGTFKRIDIEVVGKLAGNILFKSLEIKKGDSIVVQGVGFIRTAEVDVTNGESGHHH